VVGGVQGENGEKGGGNEGKDIKEGLTKDLKEKMIST
jgi:hypothetical protein